MARKTKAEAAVTRDADLRHLGDVAVEGLVHRHAAEAALGQILAPLGLGGGQRQRVAVARMLGEQCQPVVDRVLARGAGELVDDDFGGKRRASRSHHDRD